MNNHDREMHRQMDATRPTFVPKYERIMLGFCRCPNTAGTMATLAKTLTQTGISTTLLSNDVGARSVECDASDVVIRPDARELASDLDTIRPQLAILWSGATQIDMEVCRMAGERNISVRFVELGWFPQSKTVYFDYEGTNARSSIRKLDLAQRPVDPRLDEWIRNYRAERAAPRPEIDGEYIFVPLQDIRDVNISLASPYQSMDAFVSALATRFPDKHFVVRPHPHFSDVWLTPHANVSVRRDLSIHPWLQHASAVVGINSTALLEALCAGKPTHSVGVGISTGLDVMYEFDGADSMTLHDDIDEDRAERTRRFLSELIFTRQTQTADLANPDMLPSIYGLSDLFEPQSTTESHSQCRPALST